MTIKIPDGEADKKFNYVERILRRMSRRLHKVVTVAVPSIPVTHYAVGSEDGILFRYFFIVDCTISKIMLAVHKLGDKKSVDVVFEFVADKSITTEVFTVKAGQSVLDLKANASVAAGTILRVYTTEVEAIGEYWLGFLCDIEPGQNKLMNVGINAIEEAANAVDGEGEENQEGDA